MRPARCHRPGGLHEVPVRPGITSPMCGRGPAPRVSRSLTGGASPRMCWPSTSRRTRRRPGGTTTSRQAPYATAPRYALDLEAHGGLRRKLRASQAGLIAVGEPTIEKALEKGLTKADKLVKRNVDPTTEKTPSERQEALKSSGPVGGVAPPCRTVPGRDLDRHPFTSEGSVST